MYHIYISQSRVNLISVNRIATYSDLNVIFNKNKCNFQKSKSEKVIGQGDCKNGLYFLKPQFPDFANASMNFETWHKRLGHISSEKMKLLKANNLNSKENWIYYFSDTHCNNDDIDNFNSNKISSKVNKDLFKIKENCDICPIAKQAKLKYKNSLSKSKHIFDLIYIDI